MVLPGMSDLDNFLTFDKSTVTPTLLPEPAPPRFSPGVPRDTVSMINPMPAPTNSTPSNGDEDPRFQKMPDVKPSWTPPVYAGFKIIGQTPFKTGPVNSFSELGAGNSTVIDAPSMIGLSKPSDRRTIQNAEWNRPSYNYKRTKKAEDSVNSNLGLVVGGALLLIGVPTVLKMLDESFDASGLNIGGNPTP